MTLIFINFRNYRLRKGWLDKCLKRPVSEDPPSGNIISRPKHCFSLSDTPFPDLLIKGKVIELEKVSVSDMENLKDVC